MNKKILEEYALKIFNRNYDSLSANERELIQNIIKYIPSKEEFKSSPAGVNVLGALERSANLYKDRNGNYKDCWLMTGAVLKIIFNDGTKLKTSSDFTKFQVINMIISKIIRYVTSDMKHQDSVDDLITYAAMLSSLNAMEKD